MTSTITRHPGIESTEIKLLSESHREVGVAAEVEGLIVNTSGEVVQLIQVDGTEMTTSEWLLKEVESRHLDLVGKVSLEQVAGHFEMKTGIHETFAEAMEEMDSIRRLINEVLGEHELELVSKPVADVGELKAIPASLDPESRSYELWEIRGWGDDILHAATVCYQLNDSRLFADLVGDDPALDMKRLERARIILNATSKRMDLLRATNVENACGLEAARSVHGKTRFEHASYLLQKFNGRRFQQFGFTVDDVLFPPQFETVKDMIKWMAAFSSEKHGHIIPEMVDAAESDEALVELFRQINAKDAHSWAVKIKPSKNPMQPWVVESRWGDALPFNSAAELAANMEPTRVHFEETLPRVIAEAARRKWYTRQDLNL